MRRTTVVLPDPEPPATPMTTGPAAMPASVPARRHTARSRSAACSSVSSFFAKQNRSTRGASLL